MVTKVREVYTCPVKRKRRPWKVYCSRVPYRNFRSFVVSSQARNRIESLKLVAYDTNSYPTSNLPGMIRQGQGATGFMR